MDLIKQIEDGLGYKRLTNLKRHEDDYQIFWVGVLEHRKDVDTERDPIPYLISCGYGAIRNEALKENTRNKLRYCPCCGKEFSYRRTECPECRAETITDCRVYSSTLKSGDEMEFEQTDSVLARIDDQIDLENFVAGLFGKEQYVAKRWILDRADLKYDNHLKQIALELGCSAPYVAKVKKEIIKKWKLMH